MNTRKLHDGRTDGLIPLQSLDLNEVKSFGDLVTAMARTAFSGRQLGEAFHIVLEMARDPDCHVVLTLSGAMTVAKQGRIICEMIDRGIVGTVVSTGALMAHGLTESIGLTHYRYDPGMPDHQLYRQGYNRVYDTLEMEANLNDVERLVSSVLEQPPPDDRTEWSSSSFCFAVGKRLSEQAEGPGILRSAYEHDVPVFIPAFTDSEIGLDFSTTAMRSTIAAAQRQGRKAESLTADELFTAVPAFNPFLDLQAYARRIAGAKRLGILTIGGGVPRNWAQQVGPYFDITNHRLGTDLPLPRFQYGVRICPEPVHWGGLSGCTYSEGVSWGKFVPPSEGGRFAEVYVDATVALPLLMKAVLQSLD
jgi:deoxyhypusine synthase